MIFDHPISCYSIISYGLFSYGSVSYDIPELSCLYHSHEMAACIMGWPTQVISIGCFFWEEDAGYCCSTPVIIHPL
jgi:hypothetical protein